MSKKKRVDESLKAMEEARIAFAKKMMAIDAAMNAALLACGLPPDETFAEYAERRKISYLY